MYQILGRNISQGRAVMLDGENFVWEIGLELTQRVYYYYCDRVAVKVITIQDFAF